MREKLLIIFLLIGVLFVGLFGLIDFVEAVPLGITPLTFELTGNPGDVIESYVKIYNPDPNTVIGIQMEVEDIAPTGEVGAVLVEPPETESYSLARWIKTEPVEFSLGPQEEKFVKFTISIPENAEPGGHYGTILAGIKSAAGPEMTGAAIVQRIGSLVLLTVPGAMKEELVVKEFSALRYSEYGPITFAIRFENKGTVHVRPRGFVTIADWRGKKVADIDFPEKNVLPDSIRKIETSWDKKWLFGGKYTATLSGSYGMGNLLLSPAVITFWAFPWKVGLGALVVIIIFWFSRRRWLAAFRVLVKGEKA